MKIYHLHRRQRLSVPIDDAWNYCSTPNTLEPMTPPFLRFTIESEPPNNIYSGLVIVYKIRAIAGIPMTWVTEIKHVERPHMFVDEQRIGPFRFWHHQHRFNRVGNQVEIEDELHYAMPLGWFGRVFHSLVVRARIIKIFEYREKYLASLWKS